MLIELSYLISKRIAASAKEDDDDTENKISIH